MKTLALAALATALLVSTPAFAAEPAASPASSDATITLTFETGASTGQIMVVLFGSEDAWDGRGAPVGQAVIDVAAGQHSATFTVPAGDYGVRSFHDLNGDGRMNTNPFGMPTEPYAFSNNARGNMGPATWSQAHFAAEGETAQTISLK